MRLIAIKLVNSFQAVIEIHFSSSIKQNLLYFPLKFYNYSGWRSFCFGLNRFGELKIFLKMIYTIL